MADDVTQTSCPNCGTKGRKVPRITPESLLVPAAKHRLNDVESFRFCKNSDCDVVYFGEGSESRFTTADLGVPVFQKSQDPSRLVCHCFEHSVRSIHDEVARYGVSNVPNSITEKCKAGLDRCEEMNPQGSCCLGNVHQVVKSALAASASASQGSKGVDDCCVPSEEHSPDSQEAKRSNVGIWSAGGALVAAVLSSACCWLPLALIGFGASAAGVAGFFEAYRILFLGITALLLGTGFYYVYFRKPKCAPGDACAVPNPKLQRFNKATLWIATVLVTAFAAFPNYIGAILGGDDEPPPLTAVSTDAQQSENAR